MRWAKSEYILKGVFLGLLLFVSLQKDLDWPATGRAALWLVGGFLAALVLAGLRQVRDIKGMGPSLQGDHVEGLFDDANLGAVSRLVLADGAGVFLGDVEAVGAKDDALLHIEDGFGEGLGLLFGAA